MSTIHSKASKLSWEAAVRWLIEQPGQEQVVRDCYFDSPIENAAVRYRNSEEWLAASRLLPRPLGMAIDLGAGRGITSYALASAGWTVTAVEPDPSELVGRGAIRVLAERLNAKIHAVEGTGELLPVASGSVHLVFGRQVLHHANNLEALCREAYRVLIPGGRLVAIREHVLAKASDLPKFLQAHPLHHLYLGENAFPRSRYHAALRDAGFVLDRDIGPYESVVNIAPQSVDGLMKLVANRFPFGRQGVTEVLRWPPARNAALSLLSLLDQRPGRLHSFVCSKPR